MPGDVAQGGGMSEIRHTYHSQLDDLRVDVVRLGLMANDAIGAGTEAFLEADLAAADRVIHADAAIDELTHSLEERCYTTPRTPAAHGLPTCGWWWRCCARSMRSSGPAI